MPQTPRQRPDRYGQTLRHQRFTGTHRMTPLPHGHTDCSNKEHCAVTRRRAIAWGLALASAPASARASQTSATAAWPTKPLQLIVPWPAGGATDLTLRILCEEAEPLLGQPIVVINKPGAAGTQVAPLLKAAEADGHTIGQVPITVYRHALMNAVPWDPVADLSPIVQVSGTTFGVLVPSASPWKQFHEMLGWARAHPGGRPG